MSAFPNAYGVRSAEEGHRRRQCFSIRKRMIDELKEQLKDAPGIDVDNINVQFTIDGESVKFETIIPKKDECDKA